MVGFGQFDRIPFTIFCFLFRICYILKIVWSDSDNLIGSESDLKGSEFGPNRIRIHNTGQKAMIFQNGAVTNKN